VVFYPLIENIDFIKKNNIPKYLLRKPIMSFFLYKKKKSWCILVISHNISYFVIADVNNNGSTINIEYLSFWYKCYGEDPY